MTAEPPAGDDALFARLLAVWRRAEARMAGLPISNPALRLALTDLRRVGRFRFAVLTTSCSMSVVAVPDAGLGLPPDGVTLRLDLPAGPVDFVIASADDGLRYAAASLFSPMDEFADQAAAEAVATASLDELLREADPTEDGPLAVSLDRRGLFGLGRRGDGAER